MPLPQNDDIFKLVPEQFKDILKDTDAEKELLENINPNLTNTTAALLSKFLYKKPSIIGEDLDETLKQLDLEQIINTLPGIKTEKISIEFLKSLFTFKGTLTDLLYLTKIAGIDLSIIESDGTTIFYGQENLFYGNDYHYGENIGGLKDCNIGAEANINVDKLEGIVDLTKTKEVLKKILENRLYFCTALQYMKIRLLFIDRYNYTLYTTFKALLTQNVKDYSLLAYGSDLTYGSGLTYGYGPLEMNDKATISITRTFNLVYGRNDLVYGDPVKNTFYNIDLDIHYGDETFTYTETLEV